MKNSNTTINPKTLIGLFINENLELEGLLFLRLGKNGEGLDFFITFILIRSVKAKTIEDSYAINYLSKMNCSKIRMNDSIIKP